MRTHTVTADEAGQRLDKLCKKLLPEVPSSGIFKLIRTKRIRHNGKRAQIETLVAEGDELELRVAPAPEGEVPQKKPKAPRLPHVTILFEDEAIVVVDKPAGLAIHAGTGISEATLVDWAHAHGGFSPGEDATWKPTPAHRLDRETSGVVIIAKKRRAMVRLTEIFTAGDADKSYLVLVKGRMPRPRGTIDQPLAEHQQTSRSKAMHGINLQSAITHWKVLAVGAGVSLLECTIETGRTHQIRRHLAQLGHPVIGDAKYGEFQQNRDARATWGLTRQFLHAPPALRREARVRRTAARAARLVPARGRHRVDGVQARLIAAPPPQATGRALCAAARTR